MRKRLGAFSFAAILASALFSATAAEPQPDAPAIQVESFSFATPAELDGRGSPIASAKLLERNDAKLETLVSVTLAAGEKASLKKGVEKRLPSNIVDINAKEEGAGEASFVKDFPSFGEPVLLGTFFEVETRSIDVSTVVATLKMSSSAEASAGKESDASLPELSTRDFSAEMSFTLGELLQLGSVSKDKGQSVVSAARMELVKFDDVKSAGKPNAAAEMSFSISVVELPASEARRLNGGKPLDGSQDRKTLEELLVSKQAERIFFAQGSIQTGESKTIDSRKPQRFASAWTAPELTSLKDRSFNPAKISLEEELQLGELLKLSAERSPAKDFVVLDIELSKTILSGWTVSHYSVFGKRQELKTPETAKLELKTRVPVKRGCVIALAKLETEGDDGKLLLAVLSTKPPESH